MKKIQNSAALFFIAGVFVIGIISILGIWDVFGTDVINKSFQTIGLLAVVSIVAMVAGKFVDSSASADAEPVNPIFNTVRHMSITLLIISVVVLALLGVMAIWEVLSSDVIQKAIASIAVGAFTSFVTVITCLDRENHKLLQKKDGTTRSGGTFFFYFLILGWAIWAFLSSLLNAGNW